MKKIFRILSLCLISTFLLVGCGNSKNNEKTTETGKKIEEKSSVKAESVEQKKVYVTPEWVKSVIDGNQEESKDYVILEVSWGDEEASPTYLKGHIPGAVHMNTDNVESEEMWNYRTPEEFEKLMKDYGITKDTTVICYSDVGTNSADDRVAFSMLWSGVENVKCLDGGLDSWNKAKYDLEEKTNEPSKTDKDFGVKIPAHPEYVLSIDQVKEKLGKDENFKLVSIRSKDEFIGKTSGYSYIKRAGEPKGAIWGHDTDDGSYNKEDGTTVGIDVVEKYLKESNASLENETSYYCGTGWRAAIPFLIAYENGYTNVTLYDGGWNEWQMDDSLPVQVGDPASDDVEYKTVKELPTDKAKN
ncbi:sulfurtransferase [Miniphocaeibacter massiliensis]|uniref:sulfurtransferase n=1 Tax=Miniphocaeibacter massiliensis TaxID=2041841 RepID=UPI000C07D5C7|nr:rhodanese-like domain-containing protein [Miniphocaeibacter massiliensis]